MTPDEVIKFVQSTAGTLGAAFTAAGGVFISAWRISKANNTKRLEISENARLATEKENVRLQEEKDKRDTNERVSWNEQQKLNQQTSTENYSRLKEEIDYLRAALASERTQCRDDIAGLDKRIADLRKDLEVATNDREDALDNARKFAAQVRTLKDFCYQQGLDISTLQF